MKSSDIIGMTFWDHTKNMIDYKNSTASVHFFICNMVCKIYFNFNHLNVEKEKKAKINNWSIFNANTFIGKDLKTLNWCKIKPYKISFHNRKFYNKILQHEETLKDFRSLKHIEELLLVTPIVTHVSQRSVHKRYVISICIEHIGISNSVNPKK